MPTEGIVHRGHQALQHHGDGDAARAVAQGAGLRDREDHGGRSVAQHGKHPDGERAGVLPAYAAPEQVAFSRTGPWTDVHALGLVLAR
jgi:hypothetical protein